MSRGLGRRFIEKGIMRGVGYDTFWIGEYWIRHFVFDSLEDYLAYLQKAETHEAFLRGAQASEAGSEEFTLTESLDEAIELCRFGWHDGFNDLVALVEKVKRNLDIKIDPNRTYHDYVGFAPDVKAYLEEGIPVSMMSLQNETVAATNWDSCVWTPEETKTYLKDNLYPEMEREGLVGKVGLYIWDHNKERMIEHVDRVLDEETLKMVEGIAFHWYSGDHFEAVDLCRRKYPDQKLMLSECCALHPPGRSFLSFLPGETFHSPEEMDLEDALAYAHDIIGNLNAGMNRWIDWNLVIDQNGGPRHVPGGFTSGLVAEYLEGTKEFGWDHLALPQKVKGYHHLLMYDYIRHFSGYIKPGARRIGWSRYADNLDVTAVKNPDGTLVCVLLNRSGKDSGCFLRLFGTSTKVDLPAGSITTLLLPGTSA